MHIDAIEVRVTGDKEAGTINAELYCQGQLISAIASLNATAAARDEQLHEDFRDMLVKFGEREARRIMETLGMKNGKVLIFEHNTKSRQ